MIGSLVSAVTAAGDDEPAPTGPRSLGTVSAQKPGPVRVQIPRSGFTDVFAKAIWILASLAVSCTDGIQSLTLPAILGPSRGPVGTGAASMHGKQLSLSFSLSSEAGCSFSSTQSSVPYA